MKKIILTTLALTLLFLSLCSAQTDKWVCSVKNKTVSGKDYTKTWDLTRDIYTHTQKDTTVLIEMGDGHTRILSLGNARVGKTCKKWGFVYDKKENYCDGYINSSTVKNMLKGALPSKVLADLLDTMSIHDLVTMYTDRDIAEETVTLYNGYGERLSGRGEQNSFELAIGRDDTYYLEGTNGVITKTEIRVNKRNGTYEMTMDAGWMDTFFEMKGSCVRE